MSSEVLCDITEQIYLHSVKLLATRQTRSWRKIPGRMSTPLTQYIRHQPPYLETYSPSAIPNRVSVIKSRRLKWAGHVVRMKEGKSGLKFLTGKLAGKRRLGKPRHRWEVDIRPVHKKIGINTKFGS